jgi:hypothetical protein
VIEVVRVKITEAGRKALSVTAGDAMSRMYTYPPGREPGSSPWLTMTWAILDQLPPDAMPDKTRFLLGGLIAGGLLEVYRMYHEGAPTPDPARVAALEKKRRR